MRTWPVASSTQGFNADQADTPGLVAGLPRYTHAQTLASGALADPDAPALTFAAFVAEVLAWVSGGTASTPLPS